MSVAGWPCCMVIGAGSLYWGLRLSQVQSTYFITLCVAIRSSVCNFKMPSNGWSMTVRNKQAFGGRPSPQSRAARSPPFKA